MVRGRKPLPSAVHRLHGLPGKRPLPASEPDAVRRKRPPPPPRSLKGNDRARAIWRLYARQLHAIRVLSQTDEAALLLLVETQLRWEMAIAALAEAGSLTVQSAAGVPIPSPYLAIATKSQEQLLRLFTEFGMTPSARSRVAALPDDAAADPVARRLFGTG